MVTGAFQTRILQLVDKARLNKWTTQKFNSELQRLMLEFNIDAEDIAKAKKVLYDMLKSVNSLYLGLITEAQVNQMVNFFKWKTINTSEKLKLNLAKAFNDHKDDLNYKELRNKIKHIIATKKHYQDTILNTTMAGIDNLTSIAQKSADFVKDNPGKVPRFKFVGPPAERGFCKKHLNVVLTLPEIQALDNGQGLPVLSNGGGYNCRHQWVLVDEKVVKDVKKVN